MNGYGTLHADWTVWTEDATAGDVVVYRPDVFDSESYPAPCMPTLKLLQRPPTQRKRRSGTDTDGWWVSLLLEPGVRVKHADTHAASRTAAVETVLELAAEFAAGEIDYRSAYQQPREAYLARLDELTGRDV
ncbi:hypothetical protein KVP04_06215 [Halobacterium salinarum]|uniref:DUF5820 family protein n=1 Tax=Halobacterium salinarum TaxID=2242 RepID=UPI001F2668F4|nr:DUF5820 family protein [Halobacterium salinarum]MCF2165232.1 hypothetical protein [Halobacterium salinarum]MCF2167959.1 hypothetical protein [Halobacterium salinarum]MCF2238719.1 hypothetical protein [Halobacterium salinarum]